ncbi:amino acid adenylation domain-containing protein (plasmid) [Pseudoalteromonas sp. T1lg65]|uniref:amino acid adenylation domain-containing protein n=1 Tax=Pseudoalteromonas sp. T1lg65 TaxID=2077101 RepID=UPI003F7AEC46
MMTLISKLKSCNIAVWAEHDKIKMSYGETAPDASLIEMIKSEKASLLAFLRDNQIDSESAFEQLTKNKKEPSGIQGIYPATSLQQGFVAHYLNHPNDDAYRVQVLLDYHSALNVDLYKQAWRFASMRYPILRTAFDWQGDILQVVGRAPSIGDDHFSMVDISHLSEALREEEIEKIQREDRKKPFDLSKPGLVRFTLVKHHAQLFTVLKTEHHSIGDGWSGSVLLQTVHEYYNTLVQGKTPKIEEETAYLQAQGYYAKHKQQIESYWHKVKQGFGEANDINRLLDSRLDLAKPAEVQSSKELGILIESESVSKLKARCKELGITLNVAVQFAWHKLLHIYTKDDQTIVGTTVSGRDIPIPDIESSVGLYINTLPMAIDWPNAATISEMLQAVQQSVAAINSYSSVSLASLQSHGERLFHTLFVYENFPVPVNDDEGVVGIEAGVKFRQSVEKVDYPLSAVAYEQGDELSINIKYDEQSISDEHVNHLLLQLKLILHAVQADPNAKHLEIDLISDKERTQILTQWNGKNLSYPQNKTMYQLFEEQVARTPEHIALVYEGQQLSYRELNEQANQLAYVIRDCYQSELGKALCADTLVALYLDRSLEMVVSILAVLKAGAAYVPISPNYPKERVEFILSDTQAALVLTHQAYQTELANLSNVPQLYIDGDMSNYADVSNLSPISSASDLAYVIYTSGTTGQPKGVMIEHRGVAHLTAVQQHIIGSGSYQRTLLFADYVFDASVFDLFVSLFTGETVYVCSDIERKDPRKLASLLTKEKIQLATLPPAILHQLEAADLASFECLLMAGEAPTIELYEKFSAIPNIFNGYGPTENTVCASLNRYQKGDGATNIGQAIPNSRLYVLTEVGSLAPVNVAGELYISGAGLARGYLNRDELTAERFIDNPFASEADKAKGYTRLYKTGDLVRWSADGRLEFLGRNDSQVKIRGYRIELGEIESALNGLSEVEQAVVVDKVKGGNKYLAAYVVAEAGQALSLERIREQLSVQLPEYMVPSAFTELEHIPLTINGKVDKRALPEPSFVSDGEYVAPRNELETQLCELWQSVLGLQQVGINDNFFRIGGNSINAIKLTAAIREALSVDVPLALLFERKTVSGLAAELSEQEDMLVIPRCTFEHAPLSFAQERLLFIERFEQGSNVYHIPTLVQLRADADVDKLVAAINVVAARHPVMKSVYLMDESGENYQVALAQDIVLKRHVMDSDSAMLSSLSDVLSTPFDLTSEMSLRLHHFSVEDRQYLLMLWHHIGFDGWSVDIFMSELDKVYGALLEGRVAELPVLDISYADYASWQRGYLTGEVLAQQQGYWENQLSGFDTLVLPIDHPRPSHIDYRGRDVLFELDVKLSEQLRTLAQSQETTLYTVLLSGFYVALAALSGQGDIVIGTPSDNRHHAQTQSLIGFFVNSLALRAKVQGDHSLKALITQVHDVVTQAKVHQELPFEKLVDLLEVERDPSRHPIYQVMFSFERFGEQKATDSSLPFMPATFENEQNQYSTAKFDLSLSLVDSEKAIQGSFNYAVSLFDASSIERMLAVYRRVLQALANDVTQTVADVDVLSAEERHQLLHQWNDTDAAYPQDKTLHTLFEAQANKTPEQVALVFDGETLSYAKLNERANQLAHAIRAEYEASTGKVLSADTFVGVYMKRSAEMVVSILAVLKAGGAYVPISPDYPKERVEFILSDTQADLVLTQSQYQADLDELTSASLMYVDEAHLYSAQSSANPEVITTADDLAYVIYTSGTTGKPKGVLTPHRGVVSLVQNTNYIELSDSDVFLHLSDPCFDAATFEMWGALTQGAKLVIYPGTQRITPDEMDSLLKAHEISVLWLTRTLFDNFYLQNNTMFGNLRYLLIGGEALTPSLIRKLAQQSSRPKHILNGYGPTESTTFTTTYLCENFSSSVPLGKPINTRKVYVLTKRKELAPINVVGELYIGGAGLARGYLNRPELTRDCFIENPFASEEDQAKGYTKLYKTGDLVRWLPDGNLEYIGRNDDQVKIRGFRIELGEIENALTQHAGVKQAVVIVKEHNGNKQLTAYLVPEKGVALETEDVMESLRNKLPSYMQPHTFTLLESIPLTANGKLNTRALPEPKLTNLENHEKPTTPMEQKVCSIWQEVLGLSAIGIHDNFFRIGGDSIVSIQLVNKLRKAGFALQVKDIFDAPTISKLAQLLNRAHASVEIATEQGKLHGAFPLLPIQNWFFDKDLASPNHWNQSFMLKIPGGFTENEITSALEKLALQHDMLRCLYSQGDSGIQQVYMDNVENCMASLKTLDVRLTTETERHEILTQWQSQFDLLQGPLWQVAHLEGYSDNSARLCFSFHHLVIDAVSWRIIAEDIRQLLEGKSLPAKGSSYRQWVNAIQQYPSSHSHELAYWQQVVGQGEALVAVQPAKFTHFGLSEQLTDQLLHHANKGFNTEINDLLLSALSIALKNTFARESNHIVLEGHGRETISEKLDVSQTVGWFTSIYPVRLDCMCSTSETIINIKEMLRNIPNKGVGFGAFAQTGKVSRELSGISFNYLGQLSHQSETQPAKDWDIVSEDCGDEMAADNEDDLLLNINGSVQNGVLSFGMLSKLADMETDRFVQHFNAALADVIQECLLAAQDGGIKTPSDYGLPSLSIERLNNLAYDKIEEIFPATSLQEGFVYHHLSQPHDDAYRVQVLFDYHTALDLNLYQQAWRLASVRYPILRTAFDWQGDVLQIVTAQPSINQNSFAFFDISHLPEEERVQAIDNIQLEDRRVGFDLSQPGLIRFIIIKQNDDLYTVLKTVHHSITDGWSESILLQTVHQYYNELSQGKEPEVEIERGYIETQKYYKEQKGKHKAYWDDVKQRLVGANDITPLLSQSVDLTKNTLVSNPVEKSVVIEGEYFRSLKAMCQNLGITLNVTSLFAWHKLIQVYTQDEQTIVGVTVSGRDIPVTGVDTSVGLFINTLPMTVGWSENGTIEETLLEVQRTIAALNSYSSVSLTELQPTGTSLFHSLYVYENYPVAETDEQSVNRIENSLAFRKAVEKVDYPLALKVHEQEEALVIALNFDESSLSSEKAETLLMQMARIVEMLASNTQHPHQSIELVSDEERHQLLHTWNDTDKPYPQDKTLSALFEAQAAKTPEQVALVFEGETLSYGELNERANQLAHAIRARYESANGQALSADTFIGLYMDRSLAMVVSILAVLKAGAAYVPVSPEYPQERVEFILSDTQTDLVLTQTQYQAELSTLTTASLLLVDDAEVFSGQSSATPEAISDANDLAYVIYTSGTTGKPKGVMIEHRNVAHLVTAQRQHFECDAYQNALWFADYVFDASVSELFVSLLSGHTLFISSTETRKDPSKLAALLSKENIQLATLPPAILHQLDAGCFASFECLVMAGEAPTIELYEKFNAIPRLLNAYGPTESTVCASVNRYQQGDSATNIGHAIPNSRLYVLSDSGNLAPINVVGELYISGAGLARGYLNRDDLTAESFINNPFASEADKAKGYTRLYKTGDLVRRLADGRLEFLGRNDSQVKIRGYRVELGEIESALNGLADVAQAVVVDKVKGGNKYLAAYVVAEAGHTLSLDGVRAQLSTQLPDYMVPAAFTELEHIPLTINGKVDKRALPAPSFVSEDEYVAPRNELEAQLCELWQDVLGVEQVGVHDNFFRIGGNSINAIKLTAAIRDVLSVDVPLALLFEYKTVAGLAAQLGEQDELLVIPRSTLAQAPLSFAQERLLFIERFEQGSDVYHIPSLVKLNSDAELDKLLTAINVVATRHPVMKSVYHTNDAGEDYQVVLAQDIELERHVLDSESTLLASLSEAVATPFDLTTEMSLRLHHFVVEGDNTSKGYLLMLWHHIGFDGWSADIFMSELDEVYGALLSERKIELPVLEISYADYASWQRDYLSGEVLEQQQGYWQTQLSGFETLVLPTDHSRPAHIDYRGQDVAFELDEALSEQLRALAQSQETTLYTVLLSGFYVTLAALSGQDDIVIGTPSDNRHHAQTQSLIGFFVNSLALRAGVNGAQSLSALIAQVHGVVTQAKVHQELPFEKLVDLLDVERDSSRHPIYQVLFDLASVGTGDNSASNLPFAAPPLDSEQSLYSPAKFDLSLSLVDSVDAIHGNFNYAVSLFEAASIERMLEMYRKVLQALVSDVTQTVAQVDVLSSEERHQLLHRWNDTDKPYPQDKTLSALFEAQAAKTPEQVALVFENETLSYGELNERANQLAHAIRARYESANGQALIRLSACIWTAV